MYYIMKNIINKFKSGINFSEFTQEEHFKLFALIENGKHDFTEEELRRSEQMDDYFQYVRGGVPGYECKPKKETYNNRWLKNKYNTNEAFREEKKAWRRAHNKKLKEEAYIEKHGSLEGFKFFERKKKV